MYLRERPAGIHTAGSFRSYYSCFNLPFNGFFLPPNLNLQISDLFVLVDKIVSPKAGGKNLLSLRRSS